MDEPPRVRDAEFTVLREADPPAVPVQPKRPFIEWVPGEGLNIGRHQFYMDWARGLLIGALTAAGAIAVYLARH